VYDKTVRRRRAVLALLVISSIVLLTASFGGSGGVSSVQRGVFEVISPIQDGASRALKPFRDLFGWVGDTLDAKGQNAGLRSERDRLRRALADEQLTQSENVQLRRQLDLNRKLSLAQLDPVQARVQGTSTSLFSQTINIDKGSSDGLRTGQPVLTGAGLVGKVSFVASGAGKVTLLTDSTFRASARTSGGVTGVVKPASGNPDDLVMSGLAARDEVAKGDMVATRGTDPAAANYPSLFPPGIPIGTVTGVDDPGTDTQQVHIKPFVDVRGLDFVEILRRTESGSGA
jgi:rod shape-determining protein MreC